MNKKKPLVSVCIITYKQEEYIKECIEGALMQKTNFNFEIIIGDDASPDLTSTICKQYALNFPNLINYELNKENYGMIGNWVKTIKRCSGKYIALCEGDDYWTDPLKLQKQVDFLKENPEYVICFHEVNLLINDTLQINKGVTYKRYSEIKNFPIDISTLLEKSNFIHTPSVVFRNIGLNELPFEFSKSPIGDYLLYIHLLKNGGYIKKLNNVMAVYRIGSGVYSSMDDLTYLKNILIYQSCILSFLENEEQRKIILHKHHNIINSHFKSLNNKNIGMKLSIKELIQLFLIKIKLFVNLKMK